MVASRLEALGPRWRGRRELDAVIVLAMKRRVMIQADEGLLTRARRVAGERGITFPQLVRDALEHELQRARAAFRYWHG
jgi:hypothetical protein